MNTTALGTIEQEAEACRAAFANIKVGAPVRCCHHERHFERLTEPAENRIRFILAEKSEDEQARRLREFRPVRDVAKYDAYSASRKPLDDAYEASLKPLDDAYCASCKTLDDAYSASLKPLEDAYRASRKPLDDAYRASLKPLDDAYWASRKPLDDAYEASRKPLDDAYRASRKTRDDEMTAVDLAENPGTTWNGKTIFGDK